MDMDVTHGKIEHNIEAPGLRAKLLAKVHAHGPMMVAPMMAYGKIIKCMAMVSSHGLMVDNT